MILQDPAIVSIKNIGSVPGFLIQDLPASLIILCGEKVSI